MRGNLKGRKDNRVFPPLLRRLNIQMNLARRPKWDFFNFLFHAGGWLFLAWNSRTSLICSARM
ncbi:MAG: hypothetical protein UY41_C0040G0012 [Candidatus Moranbacteria bacterium GW2011_GWE1_49_15]|nr:MAG: hypothetical protein UY41_C0040G0012 [Candidatus Moranbacteria bacterium GW2011_GWE1_49_15]